MEALLLTSELNSWSNGLFESVNIRRVNIIKSKDNLNSTAFVSFWTEQAKFNFLHFLRSKQKDSDGRFIPILAEHIFTQVPHSSHRNAARTIDYFRSPMTKLNHKFFSLLRKSLPKKSAAIYIGYGFVTIRFGLKTITVTTISSAEKLCQNFL
ncbi:hypothetical protein PVAND_017689 [Polypedilum vanderplanki]|uniref:Uncharacterized protein n=1 Tax=Polypedilum vanderplanki TaxID=319348 RepID=A0A9J6B922_POLVA|nr:hypothetical protein PVAND_017689 [Polypedilum vanderplanki]